MQLFQFMTETGAPILVANNRTVAIATAATAAEARTLIGRMANVTQADRDRLATAVPYVGGLRVEETATFLPIDAQPAAPDNTDDDNNDDDNNDDNDDVAADEDDDPADIAATDAATRAAMIAEFEREALEPIDPPPPIPEGERDERPVMLSRGVTYVYRPRTDAERETLLQAVLREARDDQFRMIDVMADIVIDEIRRRRFNESGIRMPRGTTREHLDRFIELHSIDVTLPQRLPLPADVEQAYLDRLAGWNGNRVAPPPAAAVPAPAPAPAAAPAPAVPEDPMLSVLYVLQRIADGQDQLMQRLAPPVASGQDAGSLLATAGTAGTANRTT